jgi:hypothetical protein
MRSAGREFLRLCGVAIVVGGAAAALTLLFIPLSVQRASSGAVVGFCGPGRTSDNAVQVRLDPGIVNTAAAPGRREAPRCNSNSSSSAPRRRMAS